MTLSAMRRSLETAEPGSNNNSNSNNNNNSNSTSSRSRTSSGGEGLAVANEGRDGGEDATKPKSRLPPAERGVKESRSMLVEVDLAPGSASAGGSDNKGRARRGTLTFANSVSELRRAGSSRVGGGNGAGGDSPPGKPLRRAPPGRAQSCAQG